MASDEKKKGSVWSRIKRSLSFEKRNSTPTSPSSAPNYPGSPEGPISPSSVLDEFDSGSIDLEGALRKLEAEYTRAKEQLESRNVRVVPPDPLPHTSSAPILSPPPTTPSTPSTPRSPSLASSIGTRLRSISGSSAADRFKKFSEDVASATLSLLQQEKHKGITETEEGTPSSILDSSLDDDMEDPADTDGPDSEEPPPLVVINHEDASLPLTSPPDEIAQISPTSSLTAATLPSNLVTDIATLATQAASNASVRRASLKSALVERERKVSLKAAAAIDFPPQETRRSSGERQARALSLDRRPSNASSTSSTHACATAAAAAAAATSSSSSAATSREGSSGDTHTILITPSAASADGGDAAELPAPRNVRSVSSPPDPLPDRSRERGNSHPDDEGRSIRWRRGDLLGQGAFGKVFLGLNMETGEMMAVKEVIFNSDVDSKATMALEQEIEVLKDLQNPHIVRYLGMDRLSNCIHIFLEYLPGGSISSILQRFGPLAELIIRCYTRQILLGLEYLHMHSIVHRDVKGANLLVDENGNVKLADFGASKRMQDLRGESMQGTPYFMAPEVIRDKRFSRKSDIWALGCCVIEMASASPPFFSQFSNPVTTLYFIACSRDPPPIPDILSEEGKDFLQLCFKRNPAERPSATRLLQHPFINARRISTSQAQHPMKRNSAGF